MSPEQLDAKPISLTTDIYSMGILLFELLTGKPPYEGSLSSLITQHNTARLPSVSGKIEESHLSDGIQTVLQKACAKEPSARYRSAKEMREVVEGILKIKEVVIEPIKSSDTLKEEKSGTLPTQEIQLEKSTTKEEIPQKEVVIEHTYQDKPLKARSSFQNKTTIIGIVVGLVIVLLGGYFLMSKMGQPDKNRTNSIGIEFALIPSGSFQMGCSDGDVDCQDDEKPQHKVTISNSFYMGKYEVTQGQWKRVMGNNPSYFQNCGENCPVEQVSWNDVQDFIKKLCELEKVNPCKYRLPTEAEWEYAARAGATTELYNGKLENNGFFESKNLDRIGWFAGNAKATYGGGYSIRDLGKIDGLEFYKDAPHQFVGTQVVGKKEPNAWGLYDMIGNVWEWNEDWYVEKYYDKTPLLDPKGADKGEFRSLRGGSWNDVARFSRLSIRFIIGLPPLFRTAKLSYLF
jgi:formylglycine-generating enzyme required for sulfatase activity